MDGSSSSGRGNVQFGGYACGGAVAECLPAEKSYPEDCLRRADREHHFLAAYSPGWLADALLLLCFQTGQQSGSRRGARSSPQSTKCRNKAAWCCACPGCFCQL